MSQEQSDIMDELKQQADVDDRESAREGEYIPKGESQTSAPAMPTADMIYMLLRILYRNVAPNWGVTEDEIRLQADANGEALDAWFPDGFDGKWAALIGAIAVNYSIIESRLHVPRNAPVQEAEKSTADSGN